MLTRLVKLGHLLDAIGLDKEAQFIDELLQKIINQDISVNTEELEDDEGECGMGTFIELDIIEPSENDEDILTDISIDELSEILVDSRGTKELEELIETIKESIS